MTSNPAADRAASRTLLVVDDDGPFRTRLVRAFIERGFAATGAADYAEALAAARIESPEYALVDLRLPGGSGLDLVRELKSLDDTTNILVLTGYGSIATAVQSVRLGATGYLTKPVDADQILAAFEPPRAGARGQPARRRAAACARGVGAHPARARRLRQQHLAGGTAARAPSAIAAAEAAEVSRPRKRADGSG